VELNAVARAIVDSNLYMTLATADETGRPSRNLVVRPDLAIVIFDSRAPIETGQAVYMEATAGLVEPDGIDAGIEVFSRVSQVEPPARLRLYGASVTRHYVLDPEAQGDERTVVTLS
jgi:hypothetical protein